MYQREMLPITKNLILINVVMFILSNLIVRNIDLNDILALHYYKASEFEPYQLLSHMFMHAPLSDGGIAHIFSNMFGLFIFGSMVESRLGPKRYLAMYLIAGFGAALLQLFVFQYELSQSGFIFDPESLNGYRMVGASGCLFGVMAAFALLFSEVTMHVYFLFPMKAKYLVGIYALIEIYAGFANRSGDNVAHFAHIGGAIFGFLLTYYWKRTNVL